MYEEIYVQAITFHLISMADSDAYKAMLANTKSLVPPNKTPNSAYAAMLNETNTSASNDIIKESTQQQEQEQEEHEDPMEIKRRESHAEATRLMNEEDGEEEEEKEFKEGHEYFEHHNDQQHSAYAVMEVEESFVSTEWVQYVDEESGHPYWYNTTDCTTTWDEPVGQMYTHGGDDDVQAVAARGKKNWGKLRKLVRSRPNAPSKFSRRSKSTTPMRTRSSVKDLDSMGLNDGLGTDFLSTKWTTPTVEEAEQFQKMNMFEGGNAHPWKVKISEFGLT